MNLEILVVLILEILNFVESVDLKAASNGLNGLSSGLLPYQPISQSCQLYGNPDFILKACNEIPVFKPACHKPDLIACGDLANVCQGICQIDFSSPMSSCSSEFE